MRAIFIKSALSVLMMAGTLATSARAAETKTSAHEIAVQDCVKSLSAAKEEATRRLHDFQDPKKSSYIATEADMDYLPVIEDYTPLQIKTYCAQPERMKAEAAKINNALGANPIFLYPKQARL